MICIDILELLCVHLLYDTMRVIYFMDWNDLNSLNLFSLSLKIAASRTMLARGEKTHSVSY